MSAVGRNVLEVHTRQGYCIGESERIRRQGCWQNDKYERFDYCRLARLKKLHIVNSSIGYFQFLDLLERKVMEVPCQSHGRSMAFSVGSRAEGALGAASALVALE
jgi:hypothetical protein